MATIRDVAKLARCSTATVSRFFNQRPVSEAASRRILAAIDKLAFAPNALARQLKLKRSMMIGMIIPDVSEPFFPIVVKGVEDAARAHEYSLMLFSTREDEEYEARCVDLLLAHQCDGILMIKAPSSPAHEQYRTKLATLPAPIVYLDRAPDVARDAIVADNATGARRGIQHLLKLGHRRIAIVMMEGAVPPHLERLAGYRSALVEYGVPQRPEYLRATKATVADGYSVTLELLALDEPPTAIYATNARLTVGVMKAIRSRGLRCPDEISVLGQDSFDWQDVFGPYLTIVEQPGYLMGERGAELLIQRIKGVVNGPPRRIVLSPDLIVRESCGLYRGHSPANGSPREAETTPDAFSR